MPPNRRSRYSGKPRALKFRIDLLPRLRAASGACNIQVPALRESEVINLAFIERLEAHAEENGEINCERGTHHLGLIDSMSNMTYPGT
jgi:hypothetical protein